MQTQERVTRGASFYPQSTFPWGASLCAGNRGSLQRLSSVVDGLVTRFTVRRGRRRSAAVFIDRRRSHGALHCTPGAQAFCTGARKYWPFGGDPMPTAFTIWGTHYGLGPATHEPLRAPSHLLGVKDQAFPSGAKILEMLPFWRDSLQSGGSLPRPGHEPGLRPGTPGRAQPQASKSGQSNRNRNLS